MKLGIFESVFPRATLGEMFAAVGDAGSASVQFDFASAGLEESTLEVPPGLALEVRAAARNAGISIAAVSGTFNMIHPDADVRQTGLARLASVAESAPALGCHVVTLCTGTRDTGSMWRRHPENDTAEAWADLLATMKVALAAADRHGVRLVVEPEPANVVRNAGRARALLDELGHPMLKIVLDPANIVAGDPDRTPGAALEHAFRLLGDDIILAHAKDIDARGYFCAAGSGVVPWDCYRSLLEGIGYEGDLIFHTLVESDVPAARAVLEG